MDTRVATPIPTVYRPNNILRLTDRQRVWLRGVQVYNAAFKGRPMRIKIDDRTLRFTRRIRDLGLVIWKARSGNWYDVWITPKGARILERLDAPTRPGIDDAPVRVSELAKGAYNDHQ